MTSLSALRAFLYSFSVKDEQSKTELGLSVAPPDSLDKNCDSGVKKAVRALSRGSLTPKDLQGLFQNPFLLYTCFLMLGSVFYHHLGGRGVHEMSMQDWLGYLSTIAEAFGLLSLRWKIQSRQSVAGISGMSMCIYAIYYAIRATEIPPFSLEWLDTWAVKVLELVSWLMVLDVINSIFRTYQNTYQADLDTLRAQYIVAACLALALVIYPAGESYTWTVTTYMDTVALMPQVLLMAKGGGLVEAPISHFVAGTALSRGVDLYYWCWNFYAVGMSFSAWVILSAHVIYQLLVADFLFYYLRQRFALKSLSEDLTLPDLADFMV